MLDELGIQFLGKRTALAPVEDKFRDGLFYEVPLYAAALHDLHGVKAGPPCVIQVGGFRDAERFGLVLLLAPPVTDNVLAKLVFPGVAGFAPFAPVKDEIFQLVLGELPRYVVVQAQQLQHVFAGRPVHG